MTKLQFAKTLIPILDIIYKVHCSSASSLIGRKVVSIRGGFSGGPGRITIISKANENNISFSPCKESNVEKDHLGWGCSYAERANTFIFIEDYLEYKKLIKL